MTQTTHQPVCPQCAYELSGEVATWGSQCALNGICPECGTTFEWREVYTIVNEWGSEVCWYSEHAHSLRGMTGRTPGTMLRLVFPSRFFKDVNHRRRVRPLALTLWLLLVSLLLHLIVSPVGYTANRVEGYEYGGRSGGSSLANFIQAQLTEIPSAITYPFFFVYHSSDGFDIRTSPFAGYEWAEYMVLAVAMVGVVLFWSLLIAFVLLTRYERGMDLHHERRQLLRIGLLNLLPMVLHIQFVRLGFGIHAATGMTEMTDWVPIAFLVSILAALFWQQLLWTHAVRKIWHIKRSFLINIGGCFGSVIFGIFFLIRML